MTKRRASRRDPIESVIEAALRPGYFIPYGAGAFVPGLEQAEKEIEELARTDPARAAGLYETFIAGCYEKADEIDDSDGYFGMFVNDLFCGWIKARQQAGADRQETASILLDRMDDDPYGFCHDLEHNAVKSFDKDGLEAFERAVRARFDSAAAASSGPEASSNPGRSYASRHWGDVLRTVYVEQRGLEKYVQLAEQTGLTRADCEAIARMLQAKRKPKDALAWVQRGLGIEKRTPFEGRGGYKLAEMKRALLAKLDRGNEALDSAWSEFRADPSKFTYQELMRYVPKAERGAWHEKAMAVAEQGDLDSLIELWLGAKEIGRLVERIRKASDAELEGISHYVTEPAAERLAKAHPDVAAKVYRALGMRILKAGKSKYYDAALLNFKKAKKCYHRAGLDARWETMVTEVRREHHRKTGFIPQFERRVVSEQSGQEPSFLQRARSRWSRRRKV